MESNKISMKITRAPNTLSIFMHDNIVSSPLNIAHSIPSRTHYLRIQPVNQPTMQQNKLLESFCGLLVACLNFARKLEASVGMVGN